MLFVASLNFGLFGDGLFVGNFGDASQELDAEFLFETPGSDIDVRVAHARHDAFAGIGFAIDAEGGVFVHEFLEGGTHFVDVGLGLGREGNRVDGVGIANLAELDEMRAVAEGVVGGGVV